MKKYILVIDLIKNIDFLEIWFFKYLVCGLVLMC